jgi:sodium/bile acid cotransporter 7
LRSAALFITSSAALRRLLRFPPREAVAALIMSSQKTMPFAVSIIALLPASLGSKGLLTLPPLIGQVSQLFCDVWISAYFGRKVGCCCLLHFA